MIWSTFGPVFLKTVMTIDCYEHCHEQIQVNQVNGLQFVRQPQFLEALPIRQADSELKNHHSVKLLRFSQSKHTKCESGSKLDLQKYFHHNEFPLGIIVHDILFPLSRIQEKYWIMCCISSF